MLESKIEKAVKAYAKTKGWLSYKFSSPAQKGVPDQVFIGHGQVIFIEFKRLGGQPSPLQSKIHATMREHGAKIYVIDSIDAGKELFNVIS